MFNCLDSDSENSTNSKCEEKVNKLKTEQNTKKQLELENDSDSDFDIGVLVNKTKQNKTKQNKTKQNKKKLQKDNSDKETENLEILKMMTDAKNDYDDNKQTKKGKKKKLQKEKEPVQSKQTKTKLFEQSIGNTTSQTKAQLKKASLPAGTIFVDDVEVLLNGKPLIEKTKIVINTGVKYFLIGKNGCGKTTLLNTLYNKIKEYEDVLIVEQDIHITSDLNVKDFLLQSNLELFNASKRLDILENTEVDLEESELEEMEKLSDLLNSGGWNKFVSEAQIILDGLGFKESNIVSDLSGGWRMKLSLGKALLNKPNLLLLDESTNHLDIISVIWLTEYLKQYEKTLIVITHSIGVIDDLAEYVWCIEDIDGKGNKLYTVKGQYRHVCQMIEEKNKQIETAWDNLQKDVKALQKKSTPKKDVDEFIAKRNIPKPPKPYKVNISFEDPAFRSSQNIIELIDVDFSYGEKQILTKVNFAIDLESRYIIVGRNGAGKTTLFKLCAGIVEPTSGEVRSNDKISVGYYNQQIIESLPLNLTPIEYLQTINSELDENKCRAWLGKIGLKKTGTSDQCKTKIGDLSGGQKARMAFCVIQMQSPEVLLLDEPTNHLDIESIEALIKGINEFKGAIVLITHDTYLIEEIENYVIYDVKDTRVTKFNGNFQEYTNYVISNLKLTQEKTSLQLTK